VNDSLKNISQRILLLIGAQKQKDFAILYNESPARINNYLGGDRIPAADFLKKLADKGVNVNWLLTGKGTIYYNSDTPQELPEEVQVFIKEIMDYPADTNELIEYLRSAMELHKAKDEMGKAFKKLKDSFSKKSSWQNTKT
jgi:transcriptional regulator with XRE-family HTH domain